MKQETSGPAKKIVLNFNFVRYTSAVSHIDLDFSCMVQQFTDEYISNRMCWELLLHINKNCLNIMMNSQLHEIVLYFLLRSKNSRIPMVLWRVETSSIKNSLSTSAAVPICCSVPIGPLWPARRISNANPQQVYEHVRAIVSSPYCERLPRLKIFYGAKAYVCCAVWLYTA